MMKFFGYFCQQSEIVKLETAIKNVKEGDLGDENEELNKVLTENNKLKFRLQILNKVII